MQRTIRLDSNEYAISDMTSRVLRLVIDSDDDAHYEVSRYQIGAEGVLMSSADVERDGSPSWRLWWDGGGGPGNCNRDIERATGWRGTTNGISVHAYGHARVVAVRKLRSGDIAVTVRTL